MSEKPKRKMTEKQLENLRLGRERAHERMRGLKSESKQLTQLKNAQPEPTLYEGDDSSDEEILLKRYNKPKPVIVSEAPKRKPRAKKEINIESKRLELEAKLLEKEYEMKMKKIEKEEPKVEEVKLVDPPKPRPRVRIG
jgi:hypothetical protein